MKPLALSQIELIPWYVFGAYWAATWLRVKRTKASESLANRLATIVPMVLVFELLFSTWLRMGPLGRRFLPDATSIVWAGIFLTCVGITIAIWARYCLGQYWSARVTLKQGHRLIQVGPYAFVRHPIYMGMLLGVVGTAIVIGEWRGILAIVLMLAAHSRKALREEALLSQEFGEEYASYRQAAGFLFPRFWSRGGMDTHSQHS